MKYVTPSQALAKAKSLQNKPYSEINESSYKDTNLRLLGFCLAKLGRKNQTLHNQDCESIKDLLDFNDIYHRKVDINQVDLKGETQLLIGFKKQDNAPVAIYRAKRKTWIYDPASETHSPFSKHALLCPNGFEIYISLDAEVNGVFDIIKFTFSTELAAISALIAASIVVMLFNLSIPIITNLLVGTILPQNDKDLLFQCLFIIVLLTISLTAADYLKNLMTLRLEGISDLRLQTAIWDRLLKLPMQFISQFNTADLASRVNSILKIRILLANGVITTVIAGFTSLSYFVLMFVFDYQLALWASGFSLASAICLSLITLKAVRIQELAILKYANMTNFSYQSIKGMPQIRSGGSEPFIFLNWMSEVDELTSLELRLDKCNDALERYGVLVSPLANLVIFSVIVARVIEVGSSLDINNLVVAFISFNAAFSSFNGSMTSLIDTIANVAGEVIVLWKRAEPILYATVEEGYKKDAIHHCLNGDIYFKSINYQFPDTRISLFNDISFGIDAGSHVAITGESGCGKSTLIKMLLGFIKPDSGEILIDNIPLMQLSIRHYRRQLGVVLQNAQSGPGSIFDVVCGGINRSEEAVWEALAMAAIADEVKKMPMQLETILSGSGGTISGGQAQRIAIARALITKPKVLIMDEATSALDNTSQEHITDTIEQLGITRISIAHRLSTIQHSDKIVLLRRNQKLIEGTWDELRSDGFLKS